MTLPFSVGGARTVIPGVYSTFKVAGNLPAAVPAGRNILILGESEKGLPGSAMDLRINYFTDAASVQEFYGNGPISDAARMIFTKQPSQVFGGSVRRLYIWKTNQTTRASKNISSPANYGAIVASEYGEAGNFIKSQIKASAAVLPTKTLVYLPSPAARTLRAVVNGTLSSALSVSALSLGSGNGTPAQVATLLAGVSGLTVSGGTAKTTIAALQTVDATVAASGDTLTITKTGGTGDFGTNGVAGDVLVIPEGTAFAGGSDQNAGAYIVTSWSATQISIRQVKRYASGAEANAAATFDTAAVTGAVTADIGLWGAITVSVSAAPVTGAGASLELLGASGDTFAMGNLTRDADMANIISSSAAALGKISASVPAAGELLVTLTGAAWSTVPSAGDVVSIGRASLIAGASNANVGLYGVMSASGSSLTLKKLYGLTTAAVAQVSMNGAQDAVKRAPGFISTDLAALKMTSSKEGQVWLEASRSTDNKQFPTTKTGGQIAMEISCNLAGATACTLTLDQNRVMTITPVGAGSELSIHVNKYKTLGMLADFINTQTGFTATVEAKLRSLPSNVLDMVTAMPILGGHALAATNGRLKMDYYSFKKLISDNFGLISFAEGTMLLKAGLPAAEASAGFLSGAEIGATSDADVQKGLDEALKIDVRVVVPLMSRDARYDVDDALTDANSTYDIDSINAMVKSHVSTASNSTNRKERFGNVSFHGSFEDSKKKASEMGYERIQMTFQQVRAAHADGSLDWHCPWMGACAIAAGRAQAPLGTSMLRKSLAINDVRHIGNQSLYSDQLEQDFDPEDQNSGGKLEQAIEAGLMTMRAVSGVGVRVESPDLSTRSRENDPEGWVWERVSVLFTCDEVLQTARSVAENFIGNRQSDTPLAVVKTAVNDSVHVFVGDSLLDGSVTDIKKIGTGYEMRLTLKPTEALENIVISTTAERAS